MLNLPAPLVSGRVSVQSEHVQKQQHQLMLQCVLRPVWASGRLEPIDTGCWCDVAPHVSY